MSVGEEPVYENPDVMVTSPAVMTTAELPSQGPDAEVHHITIVPPWVSYVLETLAAEAQ